MALNKTDFYKIIAHYFSNSENWQFYPISNGLINNTYRIQNKLQFYILQQVNTSIFKRPESISHNIQLLSAHLKQTSYPYQTIDVIPTINNRSTLRFNNKVWRILSYISDTKTINAVSNIQQAFEAAKSFSAFYKATSDFELEKLEIAIPDFTNFLLRIEQFEFALKTSTSERIKIAHNEIQTCKAHFQLIYDYLAVEKLVPKRLIHADPKISNLLFDEDLRKVKAIIDWDTIMSGSILYDFGDMVRSYTNTNSEDVIEGNPFSIDYYKAVKNGFLHYTADILTEYEIKNLDLAAQSLVFVQAIRFLTDFLQGDTYYRITYPLQNLNRVKNQLLLLESIKTILKIN